MQSGNIAAPFWSRMWLRSHSSRWQGKTSNKTNRSQLTESEAKHRPSKLFCIMTFGRHNDGRESTPRTTPAPPSVEEVWALALLSQRWASSQIGPVLLPWTSLPWLMSGTVTSNSRKWNITQSQQMERVTAVNWLLKKTWSNSKPKHYLCRSFNLDVARCTRSLGTSSKINGQANNTSLVICQSSSQHMS